MSHHDPHDPTHLNAAEKAQQRKERLTAISNDGALALLDLPPQAVAMIAPVLRTLEERVILAEYVLGLLDRAGMLTPFLHLLINDVMETADEHRGKILGLLPIYEKDGRLTRPMRFQPVHGVAQVDAEATGRKAVEQLTLRLAAEQERRMTEGEGPIRG
jgi:hypothetical protein